MPKPTREQVERAFFGTSVHQIVERVSVLIDAWEAETAEERERADRVLEMFAHWRPQHDGHCMRVGPLGCDCGLNAALHSIERPPPSVKWEDITEEEESVEDWERFNELQRARRKAFAEGMEDAGDIFDEDPSVRAARRYQLKKRVPKVIPDPHGIGEWKIDGNYLFWRTDGGANWVYSAPRIEETKRLSALAALLEKSWTWEDSTEVEDA